MYEDQFTASSKSNQFLSKVPHVTIVFWLIKIFATTLGETGGDALSMTLNLGYAVASVIFFAFFVFCLLIQVRLPSYHPFSYWAVVVATTTVGTTVSDFLDRTLGLGYIKSSIVLTATTLIILILWRFSTGKIKYETVVSRKDETFYWLTILVANTLGTALGDCVADDVGIGFGWGAVVFAGLVGVVALGYFLLRTVPTSIFFWSTYILTRPLGATLGDTLTKSTHQGGFELGRITTSFVILLAMIFAIMISNRRFFARGANSTLDLAD